MARALRGVVFTLDDTLFDCTNTLAAVSLAGAPGQCR